jgi:ABC-type branched-subunit amino acid transport system substrate-binding protein
VLSIGIGLISKHQRGSIESVNLFFAPSQPPPKNKRTHALHWSVCCDTHAHHLSQAAELAVKYVNDSPLVLPSGIKLQLHRPEVLSDIPSLLASEVALCNDIESHRLIAALGGETSSHERALNTLTKEMGVVQIGYSATDPTLPGLNAPHYYARVIPNDYNQGFALSHLLELHQWAGIGVIRGGDAYGQNALRSLDASIHDLGSRYIADFTLDGLAGDAAFEASVREAIETIIFQEVKVVVISAKASEVCTPVFICFVALPFVVCFAKY